MTPAKASKPRMKLTGPLAVPPPWSSSFDDRIGDRFVPVPEPYLNSIPSVRASVRIELMVSSTLLMKQAEHCGSGSMPTLNQTGELNDIFCCTRRCFSSALKTRADSSSAKSQSFLPQLVIACETRDLR